MNAAEAVRATDATAAVVVVDADPVRRAAVVGSMEELGIRSRALASADRAEDALGAPATEVVLVHVSLLDALCAMLAARFDDPRDGSAPAVLALAGAADEIQRLTSPWVYDTLVAPLSPEVLRFRLESTTERRHGRRALADEERREALIKLERDVQIGRDIQLGFLPATLPQPDGWQVAAHFSPAREVAGDFYDAFTMVNGRRLGLVIADVCDKGVGAALFMGLFRTLVRSNAQHATSLGWLDERSGGVAAAKNWIGDAPDQRRRSAPSIGTGALMNAISGTNEYITENHMLQGYFATLFFAMLDPVTGGVIYVNGGHNPPVILRTDGTRERLAPTGPAVGMLPGARFRMGHTRLEPGDILFTFTDGVTDARTTTGAFFGEDRLLPLLTCDVASAGALVERVARTLRDHIGEAPQFDDITMLALRRQRKPDES